MQFSLYVLALPHSILIPLMCVFICRTCCMCGLNRSCALEVWPCPRRKRCRVRVWSSGYGSVQGWEPSLQCCSFPSPATSGRRTNGTISVLLILSIFLSFISSSVFPSFLCSLLISYLRSPCPYFWIFFSVSSLLPVVPSSLFLPASLAYFHFVHSFSFCFLFAFFCHGLSSCP